MTNVAVFFLGKTDHQGEVVVLLFMTEQLEYIKLCLRGSDE